MTRADKHIAYRRYLEGKILEPKVTGFEVSTVELINAFPKAFNHQYDVVRWALRGGCRAIFCSFGLGKTIMQLMIAHIISEKTKKPFLIGLPLGVVGEFKEGAELLGLTVHYVTDQATAELYHGGRPGIMLSNYERIREGNFHPHWWGGVSFDEGDAIRNLDTVTTDYIMTEFSQVEYKFIATATPSPNDFTEILNYAQFLGIMDRSQALTRFFQRDSTSAGNLTLYPHKAREFWLWVRSWSITFEFPSEVNPAYSDTDYMLPELKVIYHEVKIGEREAIVDRDKQVQMYADTSKGGMIEAAREKRTSLEARVAKAVELVNESPDDHWILWHDLEDERREIEKALPRNLFSNWNEFQDGHPIALALYDRHYSARPMPEGEERKLLVGPGEKMVLISKDEKALFVWRKFIDDSGQTGVNCAVFRNEGDALSSGLIYEAMLIAWKRWPGERLYTYVDASEIKSDNPGYCFKLAGWKVCGETKGGLVILEAPNDVGVVPEVTPGVRSVYGSQSQDEKEKNLIDFKHGRYKYLATKPIIAGSGLNFQAHCHRVIFVGVGYKFKDFLQAIHRVYRFRQQHPVEVHIIHTDAELHVLKSLQAKWSRHKELQTMMKDLIKQYGLAHNGADELRRSIGVKREVVQGEAFKCILNDAVHESIDMEDNSVGMILTSIPFSDQYEYCESYHDMGHNDGNGEFFGQLDYLTGELYRILQPGRIACVHVKDRIVFSYQNGVGFTSLGDFMGETRMHFEKHGFFLIGKHFVTTDVVRENNQTYRLGWTENSKDGTKMGAGSPELVLVFRKPPTDQSNAYADVPVVKPKDKYTRGRWQIDAHAYWKSAGNRLLNSEELRKMDLSTIGKAWEVLDKGEVYDYERHVAICETLDEQGKLPADFMAMPPHSTIDAVWDDVSRMHTLNSSQTRRRQEKHTCPFQFDIVDRCIVRYSNEGDVVYDPFGGLMTVPYRCIQLGRYGLATELNETSYRDGVRYCKEAEYKRTIPTLFDLPEVKEVVNG